MVSHSIWRLVEHTRAFCLTWAIHFVMIDIGILCFVFLPKMQFRKVGLPEGVGVGESINRVSMHRAMTRRTQSFVLNSSASQGALTGNRPAGLASGHSFASDGSTDNEEDTALSHDSKSLRPKTTQWGLYTKKSGVGSGDSWGGVAFKSSVADNLDSIQEVSSEMVADSSSSSLHLGPAGKETEPTSNKGESDSGSETISDVQARVRGKLAKRIAEAMPPEAAPVSDVKTDLAVGVASPIHKEQFQGSFSHTDELETEAGKDRLMNRLGATKLHEM